MTLMDAKNIPLSANEHSADSAHLLIVSYSNNGQALTEMLSSLHFTTTYTEVFSHAQQVLRSARPPCLVLDIDRETIGQLQLIKLAAEVSATIIVIGPANSDAFAKQCLSHGATHYLARPISRERLCQALGVRVDSEECRGTGVTNPTRDPSPLELDMTPSTSSKMQKIAAQVRRVAPTSATVFIWGESGTGKEIVAQDIHKLSDRCNRPFVPVNCGAISPQLIESELFGHEKGSFTGAVREHKGVFERARGGTLFLDEITEMPIDLQVKLLRVLETRRFSRVGGDGEIEADVRIVAATNRCPETEVKEGHFRADLLYRLQVFPIALPPLRERAGDVRILARHFLQALNEQDGGNIDFSEDALRMLENYSWPGNLRELKNVVQRAYIMADGLITEAEIPEDVVDPPSDNLNQGPSVTVSIGSSVAEAEKTLIFATLDECKGKKEKAANILGVSMKTLYNRLREYENRNDA
ncbi:MAG: sigma-54 dependent transcriptional regulator [Marinobacter sp.]|uniref:sigma-54 dependent transcriptional regulator n=1 Tax=Marinobacter sp. TaxID=50741 RepID=UPI0034A0321D